TNDPIRHVLLRISLRGTLIGAALYVVGLLLAVLIEFGNAIQAIGIIAFTLSAIFAALTYARGTTHGERLLFQLRNDANLKHLNSARTHLINTITEQELVVPVLRSWMNQARRDRLSQKFAVQDSRGLSDLHDSAYHVPTAVSAQLNELIGQLSGGS